MNDKHSGSGSNELCEAIASGNLEQVEILLQQGVDPKTRCTYETLIDRSNVEGSRSAFLLRPDAAAHAGNAESVSWLMRNGIPPDARNGYGWTPLQTAACAGSAEAVQVLLDAGADPRAVEGTGKTAAYWARERRHVEIAEKLERLAPPAPAKPSPKKSRRTKRPRAK